jgi:hypothetical protein
MQEASLWIRKAESKPTKCIRVAFITSRPLPSNLTFKSSYQYDNETLSDHDAPASIDGRLTRIIIPFGRSDFFYP